MRGRRGLRFSATVKNAFPKDRATLAKFWKVLDSEILRIKLVNLCCSFSNRLPSGCNARATSLPRPSFAASPAILVAARALLN